MINPKGYFHETVQQVIQSPGFAVASDDALTPQRREISELLKREGPLKPDSIARCLAKQSGAVRRLLRKMLADRQIAQHKDGGYDSLEARRVDPPVSTSVRAQPAGVIQPGVAIPTEFNGRVYRSRLEANTALFLTKCGIPFEYEFKSFLLSDGSHYCPDFYLPQTKGYLECRGYHSRDNQFALFSKEYGLGAELIIVRYNSIEVFVNDNDEPELNRRLFLCRCKCPICHTQAVTWLYCAFSFCRFCAGRCSEKGPSMSTEVTVKNGLLVAQCRGYF